MSIVNFLRCILIVTFGLAGIQQSVYAANPKIYSRFYVIGDSLADTGNTFTLSGTVAPPSNTYFNGRFSNGPIAFEYLWQALQSKPKAQLKPSLSVSNFSSETAVNFAYGGSGSGERNTVPSGGLEVPGALGQVNDLIARFGNNLPKKALYAIWSGANDYLLGIQTDPVANIRQAIESLYLAGARNFLVPNLPDLGSAPILADPNFSSVFPLGASETLTQVTVAHNAALASALQSLRQQYLDINLVEVDIFTYFNQLRASLNTGEGPGGDCLFINPMTCTGVASFMAPGYLFWDVEHPTTKAHKLISLQMLKALRQ